MSKGPIWHPGTVITKGLEPRRKVPAEDKELRVSCLD